VLILLAANLTLFLLIPLFVEVLPTLIFSSTLQLALSPLNFDCVPVLSLLHSGRQLLLVFTVHFSFIEGQIILCVFAPPFPLSEFGSLLPSLGFLEINLFKTAGIKVSCQCRIFKKSKARWLLCFYLLSNSTKSNRCGLARASEIYFKGWSQNLKGLPKVLSVLVRDLDGN
jgi:hypothetical protein